MSLIQLLPLNEVVGFYTNYSSRGQGIGSKLLVHLEDYALKSGIRKLTLTSTPTAEKFYKKKGYVSKGQVEVTILGVSFSESEMSKILIKKTD